VALDKLNATLICSWAPPLPQRAFKILSHGTTTEDMAFAGSSTDGKRYGSFIVDTTRWAGATLPGVAGQHTPPMQTGEKFQMWSSNSSSTSFPYPPPFEDAMMLPKQTFGSAQYAIDAYGIYTWTGLAGSRELGGQTTPPYVIMTDPTLCTVVSVQQTSLGWYVYYSPLTTNTITDSADGIITVPQPYNPRWLGTYGHVGDVDYIFTLPGGPEQLTCNLSIPPLNRPEALNTGRIITAHRGASCIWEGVLAEPQPDSTTGWTLTANGCGTYGTNFGAWWQKHAGASSGSAGWAADPPIDFAIARGLRWTNYGIGTPSGIYLGVVQDAGSLTITDFLNLLCTGGGLTWELRQPAGASSFPPTPWTLHVVQLPQDISGNPLQAGASSKVSTGILPGDKFKRVDLIQALPRTPPDLYIVNTNPIPRTLNGNINTIIVYYQATGDVTATSTVKAQAATYSTTFVDNPSSVATQGRLEYYLDVSNAGVMSQAAAAAIGRNVLNKYIRASFSSTFTVQPGQLLNTGGVPVDLGCNWCGLVATVQGYNPPMGGEVGFAPLTFTIGQYEYNDETQTATITPYQSAKTDISSVVSMLYPAKFT
jgi:hypothetical protein